MKRLQPKAAEIIFARRARELETCFEACTEPVGCVCAAMAADRPEIFDITYMGDDMPRDVSITEGVGAYSVRDAEWIQAMRVAGN